MTQSMIFDGHKPAARALRQASAGLLLALAAATAFAAPTQLAGASPVRNVPAGEQADAAVAPADLPGVSFASAAATVTSVQWWGYDLGGLGGPDDFEVKLNGFALAGIFSAATDAVDIDLGVDVLKYTLDLAPGFVIAAGPGTLGVVNNSLNVEWYWQSSPAAPGAAASQSFRLIGEPTVVPVPEPGAMGLVLLALSLLAGNWATRRRD